MSLKYTILSTMILFLTASAVPSKQESVAKNASRVCGTMQHLHNLAKKDPSVYARMRQEENNFQKLVTKANLRTDENGVVIIPVVVNVLYRTSEEKIASAQIASQIESLNKDFSATNSDISNLPPEFAGLKADTKIQFELVKTARKSTSVEEWDIETDDTSMKYTASNGIDATDPSTKLNIWVVGNISSNTLGFATLPNIIYEPTPSVSGLVIDNNNFGSEGTVQEPYNKGRTVTHEVGHWLNLLHIWGDTTCGTDEVADTPQADAPNFGTPTYPTLSGCGNFNELTMNYMDYVNDASMYMFTTGQKTRMQAALNTSYRLSFK